MIAFILSALKTFFCWLLARLWELFKYLFGFMLDFVPEGLKAEFATMSEFMAKAVYGFDEWYPVSFAILIFTALAVWKVIFTMIYFILRIVRG
jgi:hypothetical protein